MLGACRHALSWLGVLRVKGSQSGIGGAMAAV